MRENEVINTKELDVIKEQWEEIKEYVRLKNKISDISFKTWLIPLACVGIGDETVYICHLDVFTSYCLEYIRNKYSSIFVEAIKELLDIECELKFISAGEGIVSEDTRGMI